MHKANIYKSDIGLKTKTLSILRDEESDFDKNKIIKSNSRLAKTNDNRVITNEWQYINFLLSFSFTPKHLTSPISFLVSTK